MINAPSQTNHSGPVSPAPPVLTMGDPAGIGPEITLLAYEQRSKRALPPFAIYADPAMLEARARDIGLTTKCITVADPREATDSFERGLPVIPISLAKPAAPGDPDPENAQAVITSIEAATAAVFAGSAAAVVTNPIAKSVLYASGFSYPGHTEFLAYLADCAKPGSKTHPVMMLACDELRVVPVTIHIPLSNVPQALTKELIVETVRITAEALERYFEIDSPRIRLAGLNPHAGESGSIGTEEQSTIKPAIHTLRALGINATGPAPADTMFHEAARKTYDVAVAMYHDQALIPIKTLAFDRGVNVTLGLPFIRTSPDHGTAFDIAGQSRASPESLIAAIHMATTMKSAENAFLAQRSLEAAGPHR